MPLKEQSYIPNYRYMRILVDLAGFERVDSLEAAALYAYSVLRERLYLGTMIYSCEVNCSRTVLIKTAILRIDA